MAKTKLAAGRISRRGVGYVESAADAHVMLELARTRALSSNPKELRVVISEQIAPSDAPAIVSILKIRGYESRSVDQVFTKAVAKSPFEKNLSISVLNPRVLFFKEMAHKKLMDRYRKVFNCRHASRLRLKDLHAELNRAEAEIRANNSRMLELQHNIKTVLLIRAAAKPPPLSLPKSITPEYVRLHFTFLLDPLGLEANPPVLKQVSSIAKEIVQIRTNLGLPPAGAQTAISDLLSRFRAELAIRIRKLVTLDLDKDVILGDAEIEETTINTLNDMLPQIMALMRNKSVYGAEGGWDQDGISWGQAPLPGCVAVGPSGVDSLGGAGGFDSVGGQSIYGAEGLDEVGRRGGQALPPDPATGGLGGAGGGAAGGVAAPPPNVSST